MKKILLAVMVIFIAAFVVTCDEAPIAEEEIEYTDVVYSPDGSEITIYLDGVTVPVTKAQRAMTKDLAMMSYDFLEVVFQTGTANISRYSWELGQPASISGTGLRIGSSNYANFSGTLSATLQFACLFAGSSSNKTLFGVGKIISTTKRDGTVVATGEINDDTQSVKFGLAAIQTGLLLANETVAGTYATRGITVKSFDYEGPPSPGDLGAAGTAFGGTYTEGYSTMTDHASRQTLPDGVAYPTYSLPLAAKTLTYAKYTFSFMTALNTTTPVDSTVPGDYCSAIKHVGPTNPAVVQKRTPRFMNGGRYLEAKGHVDVKTKVYFRGTYLYTDETVSLPAANATFVNIVPLSFRTENGSGGIFSFYIEIPVYNLTNGTANLNGGPGSTIWKIRTGLGSDLYSLDDGISGGGCVFMSVGASSSDFLDIDWDWVK